MDKPFDSQQLEKRLEWLDNERRNDKTLIASMQKHLETMSTENTSLRTQLADMQSEITRLNTLMIRLEQFDQSITSLETETNRQLKGFKDAVQNEQIQSNINHREIETLNVNLRNIQKQFPDYDAINTDLEGRKEEDIRLSRLIEELKTRVNDIARFDDDYKRAFGYSILSETGFTLLALSLFSQGGLKWMLLLFPGRALGFWLWHK